MVEKSSSVLVFGSDFLRFAVAGIIAVMASSSSSQSSLTFGTDEIGIKIRRWDMAPFVINSTNGFRIKLQAYGAKGMPNEIFRYLRETYNLNTQAQQDSYNGVCSSVDLEDFPIGAPVTGSVPPFFRLDVIDIVFRSVHDVDSCVSAVLEEVGRLVETLILQEKLRLTEDLNFGTPDPDAVPPE